jgi:hypothetical protein
VTAGAKRVAIVQSSYIPWKGFFDLIRSVDEFILFDDVQFTRRDWRSRNRIKTPQGPCWLSIPVDVKGKYLQTIKDTRVSDPAWKDKHWKTIQFHYARAPFYLQYRERLEELFLGADSLFLSQINRRLIGGLCELLGITTRLSWSMDYRLDAGRTERLVSLCTQAGATEYLSGPSARDYIEPRLFEEAGVSLKFIDYAGYPEYPQLYPPFDHHVSVLDLIFAVGPDAISFMVRQ